MLLIVSLTLAILFFISVYYLLCFIYTTILIKNIQNSMNAIYGSLVAIKVIIAILVSPNEIMLFILSTDLFSNLDIISSDTPYNIVTPIIIK